MKLQLLQGDLDLNWLRAADDTLWHYSTGRPIDGPWTVPRLVPFGIVSGKGFSRVDCLSMNTGCDGPIISFLARKALSEVLAPAGEMWPVKVMRWNYWWFNCLSVLDALDVSATDADWEAVSGPWGTVRWITTLRRLAFRPEVVASAPAVFRVPQFPHGILFARETIEDIVESHGLTGFKLSPVWSAMSGGVHDPVGFGFAGVFDGAGGGPAARRGMRRNPVQIIRRNK